MKTTSVGVQTVTLNAAFLQEIKEVHEDLWHLLAEYRTECGERYLAPERVRWFVDTAGQLRDQLAFHFALEEAYGYFEAPQEVAPQLSAAASDLREEHDGLYLRICQLAERVDELHRAGRLRASFDRVAMEFLAFDDQLREHEARENDLILAVYEDDLGVGD